MPEDVVPPDLEPALPPDPEEPLAAPPRPAHPFVVAARPADPPLDTLPIAQAPVRRSKALLAAWAASIAAVVAAAVLAVVLREPIARAWPPSQRVYDALNLSVTSAR